MVLFPLLFIIGNEIFKLLSISHLNIKLKLLYGSGKNSENILFYNALNPLKISEVINRTGVENCG